jgi:signal transduction histidine kinase
MTKRTWLWLVFLLLGTAVLGALAGFWNYTVVQNADLANLISKMSFQKYHVAEPWVGVVFGSLGFVLVCGFLYYIFFKLLSEIKINQAQSEFLARVSHELKTPLSTIELASSMLKSPTSTEQEKKELWSLFDNEMKRLKGEVESLLAASVASERSLQSRLETVNLSEWLLAKIDLWKKILGPHWQVEIVGLQPAKSVMAKVDVQLFEMICQNLVNNSKKFSLENPKLTISLSQFSKDQGKQNAQWSLAFLDNGRGFNPKDSRRIFKRFYRSANHGQMPVSGTGLGLYLVRAACRSMNLVVKAQSQGINKGSQFTIEGVAL